MTHSTRGALAQRPLFLLLLALVLLVGYVAADVLGDVVSGSFRASFSALEDSVRQQTASAAAKAAAAATAAAAHLSSSSPSAHGDSVGSFADPSLSADASALRPDAESGSDDPYFVGTLKPTLPKWARMRARVWHKQAQEPVLLVLHYDGDAMRMREDWYTLVKGYHRRFATEVKDFKAGTKHWVFHKQPRVPRMCILSPLLSLFPGQPTVATARLIGAGASVYMAASNTTVECEHWRFNHAGAQVEACLRRLPVSSSPAAGIGGAGGSAGPWKWEPVMIQHPLARIEVLDFDPLPVPPPLWAATFDAQRASKARCTAWD